MALAAAAAPLGDRLGGDRLNGIEWYGFTGSHGTPVLPPGHEGTRPEVGLDRAYTRPESSRPRWSKPSSRDESRSLVVGVVGVVLSLIFWSSWGGAGRYRRERRVTRDANGTYIEERGRY